jgi:hypothetical protein
MKLKYPSNSGVIVRQQVDAFFPYAIVESGEELLSLPNLPALVTYVKNAPKNITFKYEDSRTKKEVDLFPRSASTQPSLLELLSQKLTPIKSSLISLKRQFYPSPKSQ